MDSRKPLTARRIRELRSYADSCINICEIEPDELRAMLDMLTPHPDAAVREAAERLDNSEYTISLDGSQDDTKQMWEDIDTLIAHARAVQAPRLTEEQVKEAYLNGYEDGNEDGRALTGCRNVYEHTPRHDPDTAWAKSDTRAAFPELAGEVKRG